MSNTDSTRLRDMDLEWHDWRRTAYEGVWTHARYGEHPAARAKVILATVLDLLARGWKVEPDGTLVHRELGLKVVSVPR